MSSHFRLVLLFLGNYLGGSFRDFVVAAIRVSKSSESQFWKLHLAFRNLALLILLRHGFPKAST